MLEVNNLIGFGAGGDARRPHRYWRLHTVSSPGHDYYGFHNIEMRSAVGGADITGAGSPIWGPGGLWGEISNCYDADCDSVGSLTGVTYPAGSWIGYDFLAPVSIQEIFFSWFTSFASPADIAVQYSDDGAVWYTDRLFSTIPWGAGADPVCGKTYPWAVLPL